MELFNNVSYVCRVFRDLASGEAVQATQVLNFDNGHAALSDPAGELTYSALFMETGKYLNVKHLDPAIVSVAEQMAHRHQLRGCRAGPCSARRGRAIGQFIDWIKGLECVIDLMDQGIFAFHWASLRFTARTGAGRIGWNFAHGSQ